MMKRAYLIGLVLLFVVGMGLYVASFRYSWYMVSEEEVTSMGYRFQYLPREARWERWWEELAKLETPRKLLYDVGVGLTTLAMTLAGLHALTGFPLPKMGTFKSRAPYVVIYILVVLLQMPASVHYFCHQADRHEYPGWGDSIFIGIYGVRVACVLFGGLGLCLMALILWPCRFPADVYLWSKRRPVGSAVITVLMGVPALVCLAGIYYWICEGYIGGVILATALLHFFVSARAGMINRWWGDSAVEDNTDEAIAELS